MHPVFVEHVLPAPILPYIREADFAVRAPWHYPERSLLDYLLFFVQEGTCRVTMQQQAYDFHAGEICLLQPRDRHTLAGLTHTVTPFIHFDIFYSPLRTQSYPARPGQIDLTPVAALVQPRLNDLPGVALPLRVIPPQPEWFRLALVKVIGLWQQPDLLSQLEAHSVVFDLIIALLRGVLPPMPERREVPQTLNWITSYLSLHLAEPLTVGEMARRAHLSPSRFAVVFHQQFGTSPHHYVITLRIHHAQALLRDTPFTLRQIAAYCGFANTQHFARVFKQVTGSTPSAFRAAVEATPTA